MRILESYDIDDPLDRNDPALYPAGFEASKANGDRRVFQLSLPNSTPNKAVYTMTVHWIDEFTGKPRALDTTAFHPVKPENADRWLDAEARKWSQAGWTVRFL